MQKPQLTPQHAQELVDTLSKILGVSKNPRIIVYCPWVPRKADGRVIGAFDPDYPEVICVRDLNPGTILHEYGHWYYYWYVSPAMGRYDLRESERIALKFESMASKISFTCSFCNTSILMKSEDLKCPKCGVAYKVSKV
ncbi:MAG: hypothetical protein QXM02_06820 [Thermoproteota archaeon]